jgi:alkylhydroperoxidase family enzyme
MGAPRPGPVKPEPWLDAALRSPAALARLDAIGAEIARERAALAQQEAEREAFRLAAVRATACQQEAAERAQMAELDAVDDTDLLAQAPDLHRRSHQPHDEP